MAAKALKSTIPENRNNVLILEENLEYGLIQSNDILREDSRRNRKIHQYLLRNPCEAVDQI